MTRAVRLWSRCCWRWIAGSSSSRRGSEKLERRAGAELAQLLAAAELGSAGRARRGAARIARGARRAASRGMRATAVSCCRRGRSMRSIEHWPERCGCGHVFAEDERVAVGEPVRHQVEELPVITVAGDRASLPARALPGLRRARRGRSCPPRSPGARSGRACRRRSRRCRCATASRAVTWSSSARSCSARGSAPARSTRSSSRAGDALAEPYEDLLERVRRARALNMDETGWRTAGAAPRAVGRVHRAPRLLHVAADRHEDHAKRAARRPRGDRDLRPLVGLRPPAARTPPALLVAPAARLHKPTPKASAAEKEFGEHGLQLCERVFWAWEVFQHTHDRRELQAHDPRAAARAQADHPPLRRKEPAQQVLPRHGAQPAQSLARALDVRHRTRRAADQQPRRTRPARRRHLPQALPRQPIRAGERRIERLLSASSPAAYNTARCSPTSPTCSPPTPAATQPHPRLKPGTERLQFLGCILVRLKIVVSPVRVRVSPSARKPAIEI